MSADNPGRGRWLSLRVLLTATGLAYLCVSATLAAEKVLILDSSVIEPLSNEQQTGFVDSVVGEALNQIGYDLKSVKLPAERALINANAGIDDGDLLRIAGLETIYPNLIQVPEKIMDMEFVIFTRYAYFPVSGWKSLKSWSVAIITGWKNLEQKMTKTAALTKVKNADLLFKLLLKNRTDVIIYSRWLGLAYIKKHNLKHIKMLEPPLDKRDMYVYLHRKHRNLVPKLAASLRQMKQDGSYQRIFDKILSPLAQKHNHD